MPDDLPGDQTIDPNVRRRAGTALTHAPPPDPTHAVDMGDPVLARIGHDIPEVETPPPSQSGVLVVAALIALALAIAGLAIILSMHTPLT